MICRNCGEETGDRLLCDLGSQPLANNFVTDPEGYEPRYPLAPVICKNMHCQLVQLPDLPPSVTPFTAAYPYRSAQSATWIKHLEELAAAMNWKVGQNVTEVGGNDGALGDIVRRQGRSYVNIDPTADPKKSETVQRFLTQRWAEAYASRTGGDDWVVANNVMAHVPDLDDFIGALRALLRPGGLLTVEVPDLRCMLEQGAWDTIYHEHYSYFDAGSAADALERRGFFVSNIENIPTHGGSIRLYARKNMQVNHPLHEDPLRIMKPLPEWPECDGLREQRNQLREWAGHRMVVGYGAPAKANTFLNAMEIGPDHIAYIIDSTPEKGLTGSYTPGTHIPIVFPVDIHRRDVLERDKPDIVVILAWNYADEILPKIPEGPEVWARGVRLR